MFCLHFFAHVTYMLLWKSVFAFFIFRVTHPSSRFQRTINFAYSKLSRAVKRCVKFNESRYYSHARTRMDAFWPESTVGRDAGLSYYLSAGTRSHGILASRSCVCVYVCVRCTRACRCTRGNEEQKDREAHRRNIVSALVYSWRAARPLNLLRASVCVCVLKTTKYTGSYISLFFLLSV